MSEAATKSRFVWDAEDIEIIKTGTSGDELLQRMQACDTVVDAKNLLAQAEAFLTDSTDIVLSSKVRAEKDRLVLLASS